MRSAHSVYACNFSVILTDSIVGIVWTFPILWRNDARFLYYSSVSCWKWPSQYFKPYYNPELFSWSSFAVSKLSRSNTYLKLWPQEEGNRFGLIARFGISERFLAHCLQIWYQRQNRRFIDLKFRLFTVAAKDSYHTERRRCWVIIVEMPPTKKQYKQRLFLIHINMHGKQTEWRQTLMKKRWERRRHCALAVVRRSQNNFAPPPTPFPEAQDGQNLTSWRRSLPLPTNPVWWGSMHAVSSYRGNRPTNKHTQKETHTLKPTVTDYNTLRRSFARSAQCN